MFTLQNFYALFYCLYQCCHMFNEHAEFYFKYTVLCRDGVFCHPIRFYSSHRAIFDVSLRFIFNMFICHDILFHVLDYLCDGHLLPLSSLWRQMALDRLKELKITCSNLHEVLLLVADCPRLTRLEITFTAAARVNRA